MTGGAVADLAGWAADDHAAALAAWLVTADLLGRGWPRPGDQTAQDFFATRFRPRLPSAEALLTGYYEPELEGSDRPTPRFRFPLYAPPADLPADRPWLTRAEIEDRGVLAGHELVWLDSPLEAFLAQVQGSVRVSLTDATTHRFGFAARNGHPYTSIGKELVRRGEVPEADITVDAIRAWAGWNPDRLPDLLRANASFVFFRLLDLPEDSGPPGTMQRPVTALRSLAVDPDHVPLGAPVWVEYDGTARLVVAQDTGSAIRGPGRADLYFGSGRAAGELAGRLRAPARLTVLVPGDRS